MFKVRIQIVIVLLDGSIYDNGTKLRSLFVKFLLDM
jgi:hypothetical protein